MVDAEGLVKWLRQVKAEANVAQFPDYVVVFQVAKVDDELLLENEVDAGMTESLINELKRVRLQLVEASKANPWVFPVGVSEATSENLCEEVLRTVSLDFPSKNAIFVAKGVAAMAPASKQALSFRSRTSVALTPSTSAQSSRSNSLTRPRRDLRRAR